MAFDPAHAAAISVGGAVGACLRASIYVLAARVFTVGPWAGYPHGTYLANTLGSLILGILSGLTLSLHVSIDVRDLIGTGFCGSLTTFSTFSNDAFSLAEAHRWRQLSAHLASNLIVGFGTAALAYTFGKHL